MFLQPTSHRLTKLNNDSVALFLAESDMAENALAESVLAESVLAESKLAESKLAESFQWTCFENLHRTSPAGRTSF